MRRFILTTAIPALLGVAVTVSAADVEVMTQNQYVGTDLIGLVASDDFNAAVVDALKTRAKSMPAERVKALAALIMKRNPALVGLQEVYEFACVDFDGNQAAGCEDPEIAGAFTNQLDDTLAALGGKYKRAAEVVNLNLPNSLPLPPPLPPGIPILYKGTPIYVAVVDRDVILARSDVQTKPIPFDTLGSDVCFRKSQEGCNYEAAASAELTILGFEFDVRFERGFVGVDALVDGRAYRFVNTHLETRLETLPPLYWYNQVFQYAQAKQLTLGLEQMAGLPALGSSPRTIVVGDFNSDPRDTVQPVPNIVIPDVGPLQFVLAGLTGLPPPVEEIVPPYLEISGAGFTDVWTLRPGTATGKGAPLVGFSCCQYADLSNRKSDLYERVDLIFSGDAPKKVMNARLLGEAVADKTPPPGRGLWPSDHASVAAGLQY
jgi:hypothetical protein